MPGHLTTNGHGARSPCPSPPHPRRRKLARAAPPSAKPPLRGALVLGAADEAALANALRTELAEARQGRHLDPTPPSADALRAPERIAIDYADGDDLVAKADGGAEARWRRAIPPPGRRCAAAASTAAAAARARWRSCTPARAPSTRTCSPSCAGASRSSRTCSRRPTRSWLRCSRAAACRTSSSPTRRMPEAMARAEEELRRTEIQQPAVITVDTALTRLLGEYGIAPDLVMGHSLGEYGALVGRRRAGVRGRARGGQRPRARDGEPRGRGPRGDGRGDGAAGRGRGDRRGDRRLRRARQRQLDPPGRARRRHRRRSVGPWRRCRSAATRRCRCRSATPSTPRSSRR